MVRRECVRHSQTIDRMGRLGALGCVTTAARRLAGRGVTYDLPCNCVCLSTANTSISAEAGTRDPPRIPPDGAHHGSLMRGFTRAYLPSQ